MNRRNSRTSSATVSSSDASTALPSFASSVTLPSSAHALAREKPILDGGGEASRSSGNSLTLRRLLCPGRISPLLGFGREDHFDIQAPAVPLRLHATAVQRREGGRRGVGRQNACQEVQRLGDDGRVRRAVPVVLRVIWRPRSRSTHRWRAPSQCMSSESSSGTTRITSSIRRIRIPRDASAER